MGQLSSYQETELASRDLQAKPSIEEDSVFPDKQHATTSDSQVLGDQIVHNLVVDGNTDADVTEEERP